MPGAHDEKLIAEKYSIDYPRWPLATRLWKRSWNWLALLVACLVGVAIYLIQGNSAFWAAPVAASHASIGLDCQKCHTESWAPALRLASLDSGRHSVPDSACQACHVVDDHHPRVGETEPACVACHQEHRPEVPLVDVADNQCATCHDNLNVVPDIEPQFLAEIVSFDAGPKGHPEFTLLRGVSSLVHGAWQVAIHNPTTGNWVDNGGVIFNHKVHLAAEGVFDANRQNVTLTCATCHVPDADGRYMKQIVYEQHCASCHPLRLADALAPLGDLPHEAPELVRGAIRERVAKLQTATQSSAEPAIRRLPQPAILNDLQATSADALLSAADHAVFGLEAKGLCRKCHYVEIREGQWHVPTVNPEFAVGQENSTREMIPSRWFSHASFDHAKHLTMECDDCHSAAQSAKTSDLLLPGIDNCRKCHGSNPTLVTAGVAADCVMCHDYHGPKKLPIATDQVTFLERVRGPR